MSRADAFPEVELREPALAALLAWLWPGAGHLYQRRYAKGALFMGAILGAYFTGLILGGGRVVYASFDPNDYRWHYVLQLGVGAPALPALAQWSLVRNNQPPLLGGLMAPPSSPRDPVRPNEPDQLAAWHAQYQAYFDIGTLYTMVAGLLNVLAIWDAHSGPLKPPPDDAKPNGKKPTDKK